MSAKTSPEPKFVQEFYYGCVRINVHDKDLVEQVGRVVHKALTDADLPHTISAAWILVEDGKQTVEQEFDGQRWIKARR